MMCSKRINKLIAIAAAFILFLLLVPIQASGEVKPITDLEDKLTNISEEEKAVLEKLFALSQDIDALEQEEAVINGEIDALQQQTDQLGKEIVKKQSDYDKQLDILKQVLVSYQRGGPASYLEILLRAEDLASFLKSINIMKDISHNVNELLTSLQDGKKELQRKKDQLEADKVLLKQKEEELTANIHTKQQKQEEQETYLASLQEDRAFYQDQLDSVSQMWDNCKKLFPAVSKEISDIVGAGKFALEDLNLEYSLFSISGSLKEETFNQILSDNSALTLTFFHFEDDQVVIEVPEEHLVLKGNFIISGKNAIQYEVTEGTFYDMPLEAASITELFQNGPLLIDFSKVTGEMTIIDFTLTEVQSTQGELDFVIIPEF
jgi:peptidoglycan hydrolase CwlO-like protein